MADAFTLVKNPSETLGAFNKRLRKACGPDMPAVTEMSVCVVDGQPVVTLFSEMIEIEQADIDEAKEAGEDPLPVLGEVVPEEEPIIVQVSKLNCTTDEEAMASQKFLDVLYQRADGNVTKQLQASGPIFGFLKGPDKATDVYCQQVVTYAFVSYLRDVGDEGAPQDAKSAKAD